MESLFLENIGKIIKNKKILEKELGVKIVWKGNNIYVEGSKEDEYLAVNIIEALSLGFDLNVALLLKDEEHMFEKINIKDLSKRNNMQQVRGRIIGTKGKTKQLIEELGDCYICLHDNTLGIISPIYSMKIVLRALSSLIKGSKQASVYTYLEKQRARLKEREMID